MGRFVKNREIVTGSYAIRMPVGTTEVIGSTIDVTPQYPVSGQVKFNQTINKLEVYYNSAWHEVSSSVRGRVNIIKDIFVGDGVTTSFIMSNSVGYNAGDEAMILVFVGNIFQEPGEVYTINDKILAFGEAPPLGIKVIVLHNFNSTHTVD